MATMKATAPIDEVYLHAAGAIGRDGAVLGLPIGFGKVIFSSLGLVGGNFGLAGQRGCFGLLAGLIVGFALLLGTGCGLRLRRRGR